jgi:flagellar hook-length control protein FliK
LKAEAPSALLSQTSQGKKAKDAKTAALATGAPSGKKGVTPFWRLMSAKAAAVEAGGAEELKKSIGLSLATAVKKAAGKAPAAVLPAGIETDKEKTPKEAKAAGKKTADPHLASLADVARTDQAAPQAAKKPADPAQTKADASAAHDAAAAGARAAHAKTAEPVVRVVDLRTKKTEADAVTTGHGAKAALPTESAEASFAQRLTNQRSEGPVLPQRAEQPSAAPAQTPLERLQDMAGSELTRATNLILKDGGGEIRLVLQPESLGSVRIRMHIVDNAIEGTIIVDNSAVKHVIDGSIDALRRAFTAEGFQTGSLNVSVGGQGAETGGRQGREETRSTAVRRVESAQGFAENIPGVENASMGDLLVNLFV